MLMEGKTVHGSAEAIQNPDEIFTQVEPLVRRYGAKQARRMALTLDPEREPTADELRASIGNQNLVMLRISPPNA